MTDHAAEMALIEAARAKAEAVWQRCAPTAPAAPKAAPLSRPRAAVRG